MFILQASENRANFEDVTDMRIVERPSDALDRCVVNNPKSRMKSIRE